MRSKLARGVVYGLGISVLGFWLPLAGCVAVAKAQETVCSYLDAHPNTQGVEDVIAILVINHGLTPEQTAEFMWQEINAYCPRHLITVAVAMDDHGVGKARYKV